LLFKFFQSQLFIFFIFPFFIHLIKKISLVFFLFLCFIYQMIHIGWVCIKSTFTSHKIRYWNIFFVWILYNRLFQKTDNR
jgi:hypothetical protein